MKYIWKYVKGYEKLYAVSDHGHVARLEYDVICTNGAIKHYECRFKKPTIKSGKYFIVILHKNKDAETCYVHRLMWEAHKGKVPEKYHINHKDGNKLNNVLDNLECITQKEHALHTRYVLGQLIGENHWNAKIKESDVRMIRDLYQKDSSYGRISEISRQLHISKRIISRVICGDRWKHVA